MKKNKIAFLDQDWKAGRGAKALILAFGVLWLGMNIYQQTRFTGHSRGALEQAGDYTQFAVQGAALAGSLVAGDWAGAAQFAAGCAATAALVGGLKETIPAKRPNGDPHSFPSGHTAFAAQAAAFITRRYGWKIGLAALLAAGFVGVTRVEADKHYLRDVAAGAAIGLSAAWILTRPRKTE